MCTCPEGDSACSPVTALELACWVGLPAMRWPDVRACCLRARGSRALTFIQTRVRASVLVAPARPPPASPHARGCSTVPQRPTKRAEDGSTGGRSGTHRLCASEEHRLVRLGLDLGVDPWSRPPSLLPLASSRGATSKQLAPAAGACARSPPFLLLPQRPKPSVAAMQSHAQPCPPPPPVHTARSAPLRPKMYGPAQQPPARSAQPLRQLTAAAVAATMAPMGSSSKRRRPAP